MKKMKCWSWEVERKKIILVTLESKMEIVKSYEANEIGSEEE